ncbi:MAG: patatin-like phospholipase family protein [Calditrichaceae bacterium]
MKKIFLIWLLTSLVITNVIGAEIDRPKIGLVLAGGGARGFAHIGTLKMLDSLQIPIDYIAGTSMGGIMGALYSTGYSGKEIEKLALESDWLEYLSDKPSRQNLPYLQKKDDGIYQIEFGLKGFTPVVPSGVINGQKISLFFSSLTVPVESINDFDELPIPFRCMTVDLITGNEVILKKGSLSRAMRATMSIPSVFSPVTWGDSLLIDGGLLNNLPVDVVRDMGAELVIAVNVGTPLKKREDLKSLLQILDQSINIPGFQKEKENIAKTDILITPDLEGFTSADFESERVKKIIKIGDEAASDLKSQLIELKKKHFAQDEMNIDPFTHSKEELYIQSISYVGQSSLPFKYISDLLDIHPEKTFKPDELRRNIEQLKSSGRYEYIDCDAEKVTENNVKITVNIREHQTPLIQGISIEGNESLPFTFIYRVIGIIPGESFDQEKLKERVTQLYSLGYFETITYEVEPYSEKRIRLVIRVKEKPLRKIRIGFRYDNFYNAVGIVGLQATNVFIPGLRNELTLQFAGLTRIQSKTLYPSRTLDFPVYPYIRYDFKDIPVDIYEQDGKKIATYNDRSHAFGIGIGILLSNILVAEAEYRHEYMDIDPNISYPDPDLFPSWKDKLRMIQASLTMDLLDDVLLPKNGFSLKANYELSMTDLYSDLNYNRVDVSMDIYHTIFNRHTLRVKGFQCWGIDDIPIYKYSYQGGPDSFVGVDYKQLTGTKYGFLRFDYRYQFKKDIFFTIISNAAMFREDENIGLSQTELLLGYGIGVKFLSLIGPLEFIISRGSKSVYYPDQYRTNAYFTAGYKF